MRMSELYTAYYSDRRTAYEKPLEWIYSHRNGASVEIRPTIWLWKAENSNIYFVDYIGANVGCTLKTFDNLKEAQSYREKIASMTENEFENWLINERWAKKDLI